MDSNMMNKYIVDAINNLKKAKKRPSMKEIYNNMKRKNEEITIESFKESFDLLEENGVINRRNERDSYFLNISKVCASEKSFVGHNTIIQSEKNTTNRSQPQLPMVYLQIILAS